MTILLIFFSANFWFSIDCFSMLTGKLESYPGLICSCGTGSWFTVSIKLGTFCGTSPWKQMELRSHSRQWIFATSCAIWTLFLNEDKSLCSAESQSRTIDSYRKVGTLCFSFQFWLWGSPLYLLLSFLSSFFIFFFLVLQLQYDLACTFLNFSLSSVIIVLPFGCRNPIDYHRSAGFVYFT